jgi:hypothetical protein
MRVAAHISNPMRVALISLGLFAALACKGSPGISEPSCGENSGDWCRAVSSDPCQNHENKSECRADPKCEALPYRGESEVACNLDARCFADNCPEVGCITRCEQLDRSSCGREEACLWKGQYGDCTPGEHRCRWDGTRCVRTRACTRR